MMSKGMKRRRENDWKEPDAPEPKKGRSTMTEFETKFLDRLDNECGFKGAKSCFRPGQNDSKERNWDIIEPIEGKELGIPMGIKEEAEQDLFKGTSDVS